MLCIFNFRASILQILPPKIYNATTGIWGWKLNCWESQDPRKPGKLTSFLCPSSEQRSHGSRSIGIYKVRRNQNPPKNPHRVTTNKKHILNKQGKDLLSLISALVLSWGISLSVTVQSCAGVTRGWLSRNAHEHEPQSGPTCETGLTNWEQVVHLCLTAGKLNATARRKANGMRTRKKTA